MVNQQTEPAEEESSLLQNKQLSPLNSQKIKGTAIEIQVSTELSLSLNFSVHPTRKKKRDVNPNAEILTARKKRRPSTTEPTEEHSSSSVLLLPQNNQLTPSDQQKEKVTQTEMQVSTESSLSLTSSNQKRGVNSDADILSARKKLCCKNDPQPQERQCWDCSLALKLYDDPWKIKKTLEGSDLGNLSRLLLGKDLVQQLILPVLTADARAGVEAERGTPVEFWDVDTNSLHRLTLKRWSSSKSYVFIGRWIQGFVKRRGLKKGDEIGLHWDSYKTRFDFSVLKRASAMAD